MLEFIGKQSNSNFKLNHMFRGFAYDSATISSSPSKDKSKAKNLKN
jgi:hypothetical protein